MHSIVTGLDYAEPALDEIVAGKYRISRLIGRGGMGSVWEGVHTTLGSRVAVKFIDPAYAESPEARQRFENEARAAARLNSKYAVQVYDHGMMPDGRPFIVMEFLTGEPLDARLEREGRLPPADAAQILSQVCRALARAHSAGIVHRDLKPENVFLVWDEEDQANVAKVVDFGIAKFTENKAGISSSTRTGSVLGTPYYMSPEQARGLRSVDYRTDLWSLGVIAYRCIVGRLPFEGESVGDLLVKICTSPLPVPTQVVSDCPVGFDAWFARALERDPSARFVTAQELAEQLMLACGVAGARQPLASGMLGSLADPSLRALSFSGQATPGNGVAGVTGVAVRTDTAFSQTNQSPLGPKNRVAFWIAGVSLAVLGLVAVIIVLLLKQPSVAAQRIERDLSVASGVPAGATPGVSGAQPASAAAISASPIDVVLAASAQVPLQPVQLSGAATNPSRPTAHRSNQSAATAQPAQPAQPVQSARRPGNNHPIDVGY